VIRLRLGPLQLAALQCHTDVCEDETDCPATLAADGSALEFAPDREALPTEERAAVYRTRDKARQIIRAAMRDTVRDAAEADRMMGNRLGEPLRSLVELQRTNPVSPTEFRRRILEEMRAVRRRIR